MGFEDPDRPWSLEKIIEACGGEPIDYPAKIKCCGFPIIQAREETALEELIQPIEQAMERGADAMVTPCPLCHLSLDAWQSKLRASTGRDFRMPILHLSQLIGVAAGFEESELRFKRHVVSVEPVDREAPGLKALAASRRPARRSAGRGSRRGGCGSASRDVAIAGLPPELEGLRIAHLSDLHLGMPGTDEHSVATAVEWVERAAARPDAHHRRPAHARLAARRRCARSCRGCRAPTRSSATTISRSAATRSSSGRS